MAIPKWTSLGRTERMALDGYGSHKAGSCGMMKMNMSQPPT